MCLLKKASAKFCMINWHIWWVRNELMEQWWGSFFDYFITITCLFIGVTSNKKRYSNLWWSDEKWSLCWRTECRNRCAGMLDWCCIVRAGSQVWCRCCDKKNGCVFSKAPFFGLQAMALRCELQWIIWNLQGVVTIFELNYINCYSTIRKFIIKSLNFKNYKIII